MTRRESTLSDRVQNHPRFEPPEGRTLTKPEKRALAKEAKARAVAAQKRRQAILGGVAGLAVMAVIVGAFFLLRPSGDDTDTGTASLPSPGASAPAPGSQPGDMPTEAPFPPLPDGADPALGTKPTVTAGTGELTELKVTPIIDGSGPAVAAGQTITVNYVGVFYETGDEFDASWNSSRPFSFLLGSGGVIPGWDQGLVGVNIGSRVQLDLPTALAYGENPRDGAPEGPLRFVVDVLGAQ
ncbi:FKBP-type peptidyl-prolyl cis-trans isomerase [Polymorphospora rubra]|uniref:FKBP-type peptidyl-prolyl cis-trans isomerase n=1 Tax=Polymorphospora rubra TaxID=338584 RepID=UPI003F4CEAB8